MFITQLKLIANGKAVKGLKGGKICLTHLIFCIKQAIKVLKGKRFHFASLTACTASK